MKPDRFARLKELFLRAVDLAESERRAFLDDACRDDPEMRREVELMLAHDGHDPPALRAVGTMIGQTISHYTILEKLGEGGMGVVYKAEDIKLRRTVALKFLPRTLLASRDAKDRLVHEARAAAALDHPGICTVYEIDEADGQAFIAMACIEGESLAERIADGPLKISEVLDIAIQVAEGLHEAHQKGVVHRDIKPSNVMVTSGGQAKIMDFGLARSPEQTQLTKTGSMVGTVAYMSPEQARGEAVDHRTDIWSFGAMLHEMVTGQPAFRGAYAQALVYSILNEAPAPMTDLRSGVPLELERIVSKALAKGPEGRYQHLDELVVDLKAVQSTVSSGVLPNGRRKRRHPAKLALAIAGTVVVVGLAAVALLRFWPEPVPEVDPRRIVVSVFENRTGDPSLDSIGEMAAQWIIQGISETALGEVWPTAVPVESESSAEVERPAHMETDRIASVSRATNAGTVVSGAYYSVAGSLRFLAQITDGKEGRVVNALEPIIGPPESPMEAIETLRQRMMGGLVEYLDPKISLPPNPRPPAFEALREYRLGIESLGRVGRLQQAMYHFRRAIEIDSVYAPAHIYLAEAYIWTGKASTADSTLMRLDRNRELLTPFYRSLLDCIVAHNLGKHAEALRFAREAESLAPKNVLANYNRVLMSINVNHPREAVETSAKVPHDLVLEAGEYFHRGRLISVANAHHRLENYEDELRLGLHARQHDPGQSWSASIVIRALVGLGRIQEVRESVDATLVSSSAGSLMATASRELRAHGYRDAGLEMAELSVDWYRRQTPINRQSLGNALYRAERWNDAEVLFEELLSEAPDNIFRTGMLGCIAARKGDREKALKLSERIRHTDLLKVDDEHTYVQIGQDVRKMYGRPTYQRACIAAVLGDREDAVRLLHEAFRQGSYGFVGWMHLDMDLESLRDYPPFQELLRPKG